MKRNFEGSNRWAWSDLAMVLSLHADGFSRGVLDISGQEESKGLVSTLKYLIRRVSDRKLTAKGTGTFVGATEFCVFMREIVSEVRQFLGFMEMKVSVWVPQLLVTRLVRELLFLLLKN